VKGTVTVEAAVIVSIYVILLSSLMSYAFTGHKDIVETASFELKKPLYSVYQILSIKHIGGELYEKFGQRDSKEEKYVGELPRYNTGYSIGKSLRSRDDDGMQHKIAA
jgi:hypothetical protein